ncbi:hypothetical protein [Oceanobacillus sp. CFH 90083]|uniref:hypothetical protein n=1 Tax=Oceanobacillus sp. CFH 90083 TaxID=2592336 RepID=UPI00128C3CF1|nr:hypothetical protein [Oceanobacillus sp. CFH 90083]
MNKLIGLVTVFLMTLFVLAACGGNDEDNGNETAADNGQTETNEQAENDTNNEEENTEEGQEELAPGDIESEIFSALVAGSETYSVQENGVDILDEGSAHSRLTVNQEMDDDDIDFDYMKQTAEEDAALIGELLGEIKVIETAEITWLFAYHGPFYTFQLERDGDKLIVTGEEFDADQLNENIETYVPASEVE